MSKANAKNITTLPKLRPYERVPFILGMSTELRALFNLWQAAAIAYKAELRQRKDAGATSKQMDEITDRHRRVNDKIEGQIFRHPVRGAHDALALARFAEMLNKGGDDATPRVALRRVAGFIESALPSPVSAAAQPSPELVSLAAEEQAAREALDACEGDNTAASSRFFAAFAAAEAFPARNVADAALKIRVSCRAHEMCDHHQETIDRALADLDRLTATAPAIVSMNGPLAPLYAKWQHARARADAAGHAGDDTTAEAFDAERDVIIDTIAAARGPSPADMAVKLRVLRWCVDLDGGNEDERGQELRLIDGMIADIERPSAPAGDAELIALCQECARLDAETSAAFAVLKTSDTVAANKRAQAAQRRYNRAFARMARTTPVTLAGFLAQLGAIRVEWITMREGETMVDTLDRATFDILAHVERFAAPLTPHAEAPAIAAE